MASLLVAAVGVLLLGQKEESEIRPVLAGLALIAGSSLLLLGLSLWAGRVARALRGGGWLLLVGVLCVPSTLTLLLVLVAPMIFILEDVPSIQSRPIGKPPASPGAGSTRT